MSNLSGVSGFLTASDFNNLQLIGNLREGTLLAAEEGKESTADDTEASHAQNSLIGGDSTSVASQFSSTPKPFLLPKRGKP